MAPVRRGMAQQNHMVTVVIPAFNAADTIDATLNSVRGQTHHALEILVVDDGSTDPTAAIVERHAVIDPRIRLIRQENSGVAAARNRGIAEAKSEFIAPIDADDLWKWTKVEKQLAAMLEDARVGLVYSWQAEIDERGTVISTAHCPTSEGNAFLAILGWNIIGSGSNALMRKHAIIESGGYDSALRANGGEGCEDLLLYVRIAEHYDFAVVREHLTGYRRRRGCMSADLRQMLRSRALVREKLLSIYPEHARHIHASYARMCHFLYRTAIGNMDVLSAAYLWPRLFACDPLAASRAAKEIASVLLRNAMNRADKKTHKLQMKSRMEFRTDDRAAHETASEGPHFVDGRAWITSANVLGEGQRQHS